MMLVKLLVPMRLYIGLSGGIYPAGSIVQLSAELATSLIASGSAVLVTSGTPPTVPGGAGGAAPPWSAAQARSPRQAP